MNFKTPFKVLTTAALIGTLSLSAVAPGAASAAPTTTNVVKANETANLNIASVVLAKKADPADKILVTNDLAGELIGNNTAMNGYEIVAIITEDGTVFDYQLFGEYAGSETPSETLKKMADAGATTTVSGDVKVGEVTDGKLSSTDTPAELPGAEEDFKVTEIAAINSTQAAVTFTNAVKEVKPANVKVTDKAGNLVFVSKVEVEEGNKNATLTFVDKFQKDGEYKVTFTGLKDADGKEVAEQTATFKYEAAAVKEIKFTQTTVAPGSDLKKYVTILDDLGRDVTEEHTVTLTFETANASVVATDGKVPNNATGSVIVVAVVKDGDKVVKSAKTTIKVSAAAPAEFVGSYVYTGEAKGNTDAFNKLKDEEKVSYIFEGDTDKQLAVYYKDQYGESVAAVKAFNAENAPKLENLTPTVAIVENDGTIKPISKGTAYVKVTLGEIVQTIAIEVKEDAAITTMEVAPEAVSVVASQDATSKVTFKDQYGKEQKAVANTVTVKAKDEKVATATFDAKTGDVTVKGVKEGSTTVTVTYKSGELELTKDIAVKVEKAGDLQEYKAVVKDTTLDAGNTNPVDDKKAPNSTTITVNQIDSNGNKIGTATPTLKVVDKEGKEVAAGKELVTVNGAEVTAVEDKEGTAYVQVSVGSLVIDTVEIKVVNTKATPTTAEFDRLDLLFKDGFKVAENGTVTEPINLDEKLKTIIKVLDQDGKVMEDQNLDITFTTTNANGLEVTDNKITKVTNASATVDVVVTDVKVGEKSLIKSPVQVKVAVQVGEQKGQATATAVLNKVGELGPHYGNVSVGLTLPTTTTYANVDSMKIELYNNTTLLATNTLQPEKLNDNEKKATTLSSPFHVGRTTENSDYAWVRGVYKIAGNKPTATELPNKVVTTYVINGITYVSETPVTVNVPGK